MKTLFEVCKPRESVFDEYKREDVLNLSDLVENSDKLSEDRAENVKREIIKLGAHDNQLIVIEEGARVQNYEKNDWNRVVIITD